LSDDEPIGEAGDAIAEAASDAVGDHASKVHGLAYLFCPACNELELDAGVPGCATCDGDGVVFVVEKPDRCGPDCPLAQPSPEAAKAMRDGYARLKAAAEKEGSG
jgi:hypothetical protein